jgi:hypothetical protein
MTNATSPADAWYDERSSTLSIANPDARTESSDAPTAMADPGVLACSHAYSSCARRSVLPRKTTFSAPARPRRSKFRMLPRITPAAMTVPAVESRRIGAGGGGIGPSFGAAAPVASRSISVSRATRAESACACARARA